MDIIVDRPQLVRVVLLYLNMNFGDLTLKTSINRPNSVYYVNLNDEVMMEYDKKTNSVYIDYDLWSKIDSLVHINYGEIQSIIKVWLEEKPYELKNVLPIGYVSGTRGWKKIPNLI